MLRFYEARFFKVLSRSAIFDYMVSLASRSNEAAETSQDNGSEGYFPFISFDCDGSDGKI